ncbi:hypothetical protein [Bradyrhizobium sp. 87]|uniref:hypothetical protein n=1 Tax=Bradyrhizobium sp. 87 TaxID=2782682 RepID=UPI001FFBF371|nr:hypothetical protein [Bradyrhizobium sp. 87]MCK1427438.1 hypothetical protein [Bradyrhizobium sp. 87]
MATTTVQREKFAFALTVQDAKPPGGTSFMDAKAFLSRLKTELEKNARVDGLNEILAQLDDAALLPELLDYVTHQNDRAEVKNSVTALRRLAEDRTANRNTKKLVCMSFTGAGIATMVGSFAVVASLATGFFVVPLLVGGIVATHGGLAAFRATEEEKKYQQIVDRVKEIEAAIAEKFK